MATKATVRGGGRGFQVVVGDKVLLEYDRRADDYAYTNAQKAAERYNRNSTLTPNATHHAQASPANA